jgi:hypothetical protein
MAFPVLCLKKNPRIGEDGGPGLPEIETNDYLAIIPAYP